MGKTSEICSQKEETLVRLDLVWTSPTQEQTGPTNLCKLTLTCFIHGIHRTAEDLEK